MAEYSAADEGPDHPEQEEKKVAISVHLIVQRHLPPDAGKWPQEQIVSELNKITHLRLDRENIGKVDNLEILGNSVTNVYLQHNKIERIENLECLTNLRFITLSSNRISRVEGLRHLEKLGFLDLSDNLVGRVHINELPKSLVILSFRDNPCTEKPNHRLKLIEALPKLRQLDNVELTNEERRAAGYEVSSEEEEDSEDDSDLDMLDMQKAIDEFYEATVEDVMKRAQDRQVLAMKQHARRMDMLDKIREESGLPQSSRSKGATGQRSPTKDVEDTRLELSNSATNVVPQRTVEHNMHKSKSATDKRLSKGSKGKG